MAIPDLEMRLRLLEQLPAILWSVDHDLVFTTSLGAALTEIGTAPGASVGKTLWEFFGTNDPSFKPIAAHLAALRGEQADYELDWKGRIFEVHVEPLRVDGTIAGAIGLAHDVTKVREAESLFRLIAENAADFVSIVTLEERYIYTSPSMTKTFGYSQEELRELDPKELIHPDDRRRVTETIYESLDEKGSGTATFRFRCKDGKYLWIEAQATFIRYKGAPHLLGIARDVTERRRLHEELAQAQKLDSIGRLAGGMAHDFNNLLTVILANAETAMMAVPENSSAHADLEAVRDAGRRAADLTKSLLAFARRQPVEPRLTDVNQLLGRFGKLLRALLGPSIELSIEPNASSPVKIDPVQFEQVILNLAVNARDAMPKGGALSVEARDDTFLRRDSVPVVSMTPGKYVCITVRDTGEGMSPEVLSHLFEPFFTTKERGSGTGLGLATCHGIVRQAGGHIVAKSALGKGTAFAIYLPVAAAERPITAETGGTCSRCVLVVEDDALVRGLVERVLRSNGFEVRVASSAAEARDESAASQFDLLICDLDLPDANGEHLAGELKAAGRTVKVLLMSGHPEKTMQYRARPDGGSLLVKPFTAGSLLSAVRGLLAV